MSLTGIDTSQLINQNADSDIVKKMLSSSSLTWDRLPIGCDNQAYFATLSENYPGPNISRETIFAKKLDPKFPDSHEACDFYIIEINFWKYDDEKPAAKFEIAHGVKADFTSQQAISLLGRPTNDDGNTESYHWEYPNHDLNISFEGRVYSAILSSNTPETLEIIDQTMAKPSLNQENQKTTNPKKHNKAIDSPTLTKTELGTVTEPKNNNLWLFIGFIVVTALALGYFSGF